MKEERAVIGLEGHPTITDASISADGVNENEKDEGGAKPIG